VIIVHSFYFPTRIADSIRRTLPGLALLALTACHGPYTYTFNDNVVYSPNRSTNPNDYLLHDAGLQACLNQFLQGSGITDLNQVQLLACPGLGIEGLEGIEKLPALEQLELSDNKIKELTPLATLKNLRVLGLRNNPIKSLRPLNDLQLLRFLSLQGDDQLPCSEVNALKAKLGNTLSPPDHCKQ